MSRYNLDPVYALELLVSELHGKLAVEVAQFSVDTAVAAKASKSALLVSDLWRTSFVDMSPFDGLHCHNSNTTQELSCTYSWCALATGNSYKLVLV